MSDLLLALAIEVVGEGAAIESEDHAGVFTLRVLSAEEVERRGAPEAPAEEEPPARKRRRPDTSPKAPPVHPWTVEVPSSPSAASEARELLRRRLLRAHGDIARTRGQRAELEAAFELSNGRHVRAGLRPCPPETKGRPGGPGGPP